MPSAGPLWDSSHVFKPRAHLGAWIGSRWENQSNCTLGCLVTLRPTEAMARGTWHLAQRAGREGVPSVSLCVCVCVCECVCVRAHAEAHAFLCVVPAAVMS